MSDFCYECGSAGHFASVCPNRNRPQPATPPAIPASWLGPDQLTRPAEEVADYPARAAETWELLGWTRPQAGDRPWQVPPQEIARRQVAEYRASQAQVERLAG